jgi:hypothetical protein
MHKLTIITNKNNYYDRLSNPLLPLPYFIFTTTTTSGPRPVG